MTWDLVGDIGGTSCRLAVAQDGTLKKQAKLPTDAGLTDAVIAFAKEQNSPPKTAALAGAGIPKNGKIELTNANAVLDLSAIEQACAPVTVTLLNDFEAAAWALPNLDQSELEFVQGKTLGDGPRLIVGVGTGLGVGLWTGKHALKTEGGHVTIQAFDAEEAAMFDALRNEWPETFTGLGFEAEAIVSGTGLPRVYNAYAAVAVNDQRYEEAADVLSAAQQGDPIALQTTHSFTRHLGKICGDLFVASWSNGGVVLTGGVLCKNPWLLDAAFMEGLHAGGRYTNYRQDVPVALWESDDIGLLGAAAFAAS